MKTAYDRGYEMGLESHKGVLPTLPHHYNEKDRAEWLDGFCRGYLARWSQGKRFYPESAQ